MKPSKSVAESLLAVSGSYWKTCALHAGVKLRLFTALEKGPLTGKDIAAFVKGNERGIIMLLNALTAMELLKKVGDRYGNTEASFCFLSEDSENYIGHIIMHHHYLMESWSRLDEAVKSGKPIRQRASVGMDKARESFLMGMFNIAMNLAPKIVSQIDLAGRRHLLDLGGGPGTYAIQFCLKNPRLKATIYDLPTTKPFAEKTMARFNLKQRVRFSAGDFLTDEIGEGYDVAWLSHILHGEGPENVRRIIVKATAALEKGGLIMIHEFLLDDSMDSPLHPALFSLNMLLGTTEGRSYAKGEIREMLAQAGVQKIRILPLRLPNDSRIIVGMVP